MHATPPHSLVAKDRLEQLGKFADDRWREYDSKSQAEWKVSFALWAAAIAAIGGTLARPAADSIPNVIKAGILPVAIAATLLHLAFLAWIQYKLAQLRPEMNVIARERRQLLGLAAVEPAGWGPSSLIIQILITIFLFAILVRVVSP